MKHEFFKKAPVLRVVVAVAALSITLSIGGIIEFLATDYAVMAGAGHPVTLAAVEMTHW